jgi:YVTN family beta-propeller protein
VDGRSNTVIANIPVPSASYHLGIDVNPWTNMVYVSNGGSNTVSVISGSSNTVIANIPVGPQPYGVGVDVRMNMVYVANSFGTSNSSTVSVIDGRTNTVTATIKAPAWAIDVGVNPRTELIYVAEYYICKSSSCANDPNQNSVLVISGASSNQETD